MHRLGKYENDKDNLTLFLVAKFTGNHVISFVTATNNKRTRTFFLEEGVNFVIPLLSRDKKLLEIGLNKISIKNPDGSNYMFENSDDFLLELSDFETTNNNIPVRFYKNTFENSKEINILYSDITDLEIKDIFLIEMNYNQIDTTDVLNGLTGQALADKILELTSRVVSDDDSNMVIKYEKERINIKFAIPTMGTVVFLYHA